MAKRKCTHCDGKGYVTATSGAFEGISVECDRCDHGWVESEGYGLNLFSKEAREISRANGFEGPSSIEDHLQVSQKLMLIVSECAEAMEVARKTQDMDAFGEELVDVLIRVVDLGYDMGVDFDAITDRKMAKNRERGFRHGGRAF